MEIEFVAKHVELTRALRAEIAERLVPVVRFVPGPLAARVVLEGGAGEKRRFSVEIEVAHRNGELRAGGECADLGAGIAGATDAVVEQARREGHRRIEALRKLDREEAARRDARAASGTEL